jgi:hypothetical protein
MSDQLHAPYRFTPGERATGTHWKEGWSGPRAGQDDIEKQIFLPFQESNSYPLVVQLVASRRIDCATPALNIHYITHILFPVPIATNCNSVLL